MKKILRITAFAALLVAGGCMNHLEDEKSYDTFDISIKLNYPADSRADAQTTEAGVIVTMTNTASNTVFEAATDAAGVATFTLVPGPYIASVTDKRADNGVITLFKGSVSRMNLTQNDSNKQVVIDLQKSKTSQLIIKEFYFGGCPPDPGTKSALYSDKYVILYNNSDVDAPLDNLCLAIMAPFNANGNNSALVDGKLEYDKGAESVLPATQALWYFDESQKEVVVPPGEQIVIALNTATNHTATYSQSVDLIDPSYYVTYDPVTFTKQPQPSSTCQIPPEHYLKAMKRAGITSTSWVVSQMSPALFIFAAPTDVDLPTYLNEHPYDYSLKTNNGYSIPIDWVLDAVEIYQSGKEADSNKRILDVVDNGYLVFTNQLGYTAYRNVDAEATQAIPGNAEKLVYGYQYGTEDVLGGSTDPSGIDAEASIRNGARIVYQDTNNSSADFHMRRQASLRDNM